MSQFDRVANHILSKLDENFINSASDAIQHTWAKTIAHPGLGEEDEEFAVVDHSLTSDGVITEYYVKHKGKLVAVPANEAKVVVIKEHAEEDEHGEKPKRDDADDEWNKAENKREKARDRGREAEDKGDWDEWNRQENKREAARDKGK